MIHQTPDLRRHRFTVHDYYRMAVAGILERGARVELLDGEVLEMTPIGPEHASIVDRLTEAFAPAVQSGLALMRVQGPLRIDLLSELQPDLMLLKRRDDYYCHEHPTARDVLLLVEVADTSVRRDREVKLPLYAQAGVSEVWVIDCEGRCLISHCGPAGAAYRRIREHRGADRVAPAALPGHGIAVRDLLG